MANILSLAMKINADASGVVKNLTPAERALERLAGEADKVTKVFDEFAGTSSAAANAQAQAAESLQILTAQLKSGAISAQQFAQDYAELSAEINKEAAAFKRAAQITEANLSPTQRYEAAVAELNAQLRAGRISQETYNRAMEKARADLDRAGTSAQKTDKSMESLTRNVRFLAGVELGRLFVGGVQAIGNAIRDVATRITSLVASVNTSLDSLNDFSARTGIGVEALQGYSLAAKLAGVDTEQFGAAVQKLAVSIGKATPGDALDKALNGINLSLADLRALSPEQQFSEIGEAISQLPTAADRAAAAVAIFGQQGAALAPLFREGAASIEELQARAERLGIIVSEQQVGNVADMNDAFDLVRATIDGIIGQVIGNLAPAVTAVTDQFLRFVEEWSGAQGEGGTGIANAITDVLLEGAEYFAGIFDLFVENFGDLGETFAFAADVFDLTSKILLSAAEGLRAGFNAVQLGIDALLIGFGKIVESLGSYVSDDLEQFGAGLAAASEENAKRNATEMEAAAANAAETFNNIFTGGDGNAVAAGQGAAQQFLRGLRSEIENARSPEVKVQADLGDAQERLDVYFRTAENGGSAFFQQSAETVAKFQEMAAAGGLTADQIAIMNRFMDDLNGKLNQEIAARKDAAAAAAKQGEDDAKRIDSLLKTSDAAAKVREDLDTVSREQARVSELLADPRASAAEISAAQERLEELEQLQGSLAEKAQAASQGFSEGFGKAFESTNSGLTSLIVKSEEFGQAGAAASEQLRAGIELAQNQAAGGILTKEAYDLEVERQKRFFEQRIEQVKQEAEERLKTQKAVEDILFAAQYGYNSERIKAAENLNLINQEIAATEERVAAARAAGDREEINALSQRLQALDQAAAREQDIASGRAKEREEEEKRVKKIREGIDKEQKKAQEKYAKEQERILEQQRKAAEAEAKRQEERLSKLNTLGDQTINVQDIRTSEGAALVLNLAAAAQDPALVQQRLQTKLLQEINAAIRQSALDNLNPRNVVGIIN